MCEDWHQLLGYLVWVTAFIPALSTSARDHIRNERLRNGVEGGPVPRPDDPIARFLEHVGDDYVLDLSVLERSRRQRRRSASVRANCVRSVVHVGLVSDCGPGPACHETLDRRAARV